jgi:LAO/AO transport system kinase
VTRPLDVRALAEQARSGSARAVGRLMTLAEQQAPELAEAYAVLAAYAGHAHVVGLTGAPGVGKSTLTSVLVAAYRDEHLRVAVLAVDPSSPFSGGALLGDRIRMQAHSLDADVFIRSMSSRGHLGGLSSAAPQAIRLLDAVGYDVVLVETVGVGQSEIEVVELADTTIVLLAPGAGDGVQAAKAGVLEVGDVFVVNKADRDGARASVRDLRGMLRMGAGPRSGPPQDPWAPPVIRTVATTGDGTAELVAAVAAHHQWLTRTGMLGQRKQARARQEVCAIALGLLRRRLLEGAGAEAADDLAASVAAGSLTPYAAAQALVERTGPAPVRAPG